MDEPIEQQLAEVAAKASQCTACRLAQTRTNVVFGEGNPRSPLVLVGEPALLQRYAGALKAFGHEPAALLGNSAPDPAWPLHASFLRMIDFIAGMTDSYATEMAREMTGRSSPQ